MGNKTSKKSDIYTDQQTSILSSYESQHKKSQIASSTHLNSTDFTKFGKEEQSLLMQLTNCLLSNKISSNDIIQLLISVQPGGPQWLLYQCQQLLNINITIHMAIIIIEYASNIEIYDLQNAFMIPNNTSLYNLYPIQLSISFWCKPKELNRYQTILTTEPLNSNPRTYGWGFRFRRQGVFWFNVMTGHGYGSVCCESKTCVTNATINKWYHICGIYNGINGEVKIYVNGILENTSNVDNSQYPLQFTAQNGLQIGSLINNGGQTEASLCGHAAASRSVVGNKQPSLHATAPNNANWAVALSTDSTGGNLVRDIGEWDFNRKFAEFVQLAAYAANLAV